MKKFRSISLIWMGSIINSISNFLILLLLTKILSANEYGLFTSSLSIVLIFSFIGGLGLSQSLLKIFAEEGVRGKRWINSSFKYLFITILSTILLLLLWIFLAPNDNQTKITLIILIIFMISQILLEIIHVKYQLEQSYMRLSFWQMIPSFIRLIVILLYFLFADEFKLYDITLIYAIVSIGIITYSLLELKKMNSNKFNIIEHKNTDNNTNKNIHENIINVFKISFPFGIASVLSFIYVQSDVIMIKYLISNEAAAYYNVAFIILTAIYLLPSVFYQKYLLPKIHQWSVHDKNQLYYVYKLGFKYMFIIGFLLMIFIIMYSKYIIHFLYGESYNKSIDIIIILAVSIPFYLLSFSSATILTTKKNIQKKVYYMLIVAISNISLNLVFIPKYGAEGAAYATVISNVLLLFLYNYGVNKYTFNKDFHETINKKNH